MLVLPATSKWLHLSRDDDKMHVAHLCQPVEGSALTASTASTAAPHDPFWLEKDDDAFGC